MKSLSGLCLIGYAFLCLGTSLVQAARWVEDFHISFSSGYVKPKLTKNGNIVFKEDHGFSVYESKLGTKVCDTQQYKIPECKIRANENGTITCAFSETNGLVFSDACDLLYSWENDLILGYSYGTSQAAPIYMSDSNGEDRRLYSIGCKKKGNKVSDCKMFYTTPNYRFENGNQIPLKYEKRVAALLESIIKGRSYDDEVYYETNDGRVVALLDYEDQVNGDGNGMMYYLFQKDGSIELGLEIGENSRIPRYSGSKLVYYDAEENSVFSSNSNNIWKKKTLNGDVSTVGNISLTQSGSLFGIKNSSDLFMFLGSGQSKYQSINPASSRKTCYSSTAAFGVDDKKMLFVDACSNSSEYYYFDFDLGTSLALGSMNDFIADNADYERIMVLPGDRFVRLPQPNPNPYTFRVYRIQN